MKKRITEEHAETINVENSDQFGDWNYNILSLGVSKRK